MWNTLGSRVAVPAWLAPLGGHLAANQAGLRPPDAVARGLASSYAPVIHVVLDNPEIHRMASLRETFPAAEAMRIVKLI